MKEQVIRSGNREIYFMGELLFEETTHKEEGPNKSRWWRAMLFNTDMGFYRVGVAYISKWEDTDRHQFFKHDSEDKEDILAFIAKHDQELADKVKIRWNHHESVGSRMEP
jgi:hypothetical protein